MMTKYPRGIKQNFILTQSMPLINIYYNGNSTQTLSWIWLKTSKMMNSSLQKIYISYAKLGKSYIF